MRTLTTIRICTALLLITGWSQAATAQVSSEQTTSINNTVNLGFQLNQYQRDFGTGVTLTSPWFANQKIALRARGNLMFHEHLDGEVMTWTPYINTTLGVVSMTGRVGDAIRLYGEGGVAGLFPSSDLSSESFAFGGYGLFGFAFYMTSGSNYFIEIGGIGTGARADEVAGDPIYSNGLVLSAGFRFSL